MISNYIKTILYILIVLAIQIWGLNDIRLFRMATPYIYPIILLFLPIGLSKTNSILVAFFTGLLIDSIVYTPGLNTASFTVIGFMRPYLIKPLLDSENILMTKTPTIYNIKWKSILLMIEFIAINTILLFIFDSFGVSDISYLFCSLGSSMVLSFLVGFIFVYIYDLIFH